MTVAALLPLHSCSVSMGSGVLSPFLHEAEKPSEYAIIQWPRKHFTSLDLGIFGRNETCLSLYVYVQK